jgi:hypothetical protein
LDDSLVPVLFKYHMAMNFARQEFYRYLKVEAEKFELDADPVQSGMEVLVSKSGIMMAYWYGMLQVVIDGWVQLELSDSEIDELLKSPNKKLLWDFRNGLFHFQRQFLPDKHQPLFAQRSFVPWVTALSDAFRRFLLSEMRRINSKNA